MSSYFDTIASASAVERTKLSDEAFLEYVIRADRKLFDDVTIITGDREFPDDLREKMMGVFATRSAFQPGDLEIPEFVRTRVPAYGYSLAAEDLHDLFHELASRKVWARFGMLNDNPKAMRERRDEHDAGR